MIANAIMSCIKKRSFLIMKYAKNLLWFFTVSIVLTPPIAARRGLTSRQVRQLRSLEKKFDEHMLTFRRNATDDEHTDWKEEADKLVEEMKVVDPATPRIRDAKEFLNKKALVRREYVRREKRHEIGVDLLISDIKTYKNFEQWKENAEEAIYFMKEANINPKLLADLEKKLVNAQKMREQEEKSFTGVESNLTTFLKTIQDNIQVQINLAEQDNPNFTKIYDELKKIYSDDYPNFTNGLKIFIQKYPQQVDTEKWETYKQNVTDHLKTTIYVLANKYMDTINEYLKLLTIDVNELVDKNLPLDLEKTSHDLLFNNVNLFFEKIIKSLRENHFTFEKNGKPYLLFYADHFYLLNHIEKAKVDIFKSNMKGLLATTGKKQLGTWKTLAEEKIKDITEIDQVTLPANTLLSLFIRLGHIFDPEEKLLLKDISEIKQYGEQVISNLEERARPSIWLTETAKIIKKIKDSDITAINNYLYQIKFQVKQLETIRETILKNALGEADPVAFANEEEKKSKLALDNIVDNKTMIEIVAIATNKNLSKGAKKLADMVDPTVKLIEAQKDTKDTLEENLEMYQDKLKTLQDETNTETQKSDIIGTHVNTVVAAVEYAAEAQTKIKDIEKQKTVLEDQKSAIEDSDEKKLIDESAKNASEAMGTVTILHDAAKEAIENARLEIEKLKGVDTSLFKDKLSNVIEQTLDKAMEDAKALSKEIEDLVKASKPGFFGKIAEILGAGLESETE